MGTDPNDHATASATSNSQTAAATASSAQPALAPSSTASSHPAAAPAGSVAASKGAAPTAENAAPPSGSGAGEGKAQGGDGDASAASDQQRDEDELLGTETDEVVDMEVFNQLLEIDDDDDREFSKSLAYDYIQQADTTIDQIKEALETRDLEVLSARGHFLKGSSAALGLRRVQHSCEALQHFGKRLDAHGEGPECDDEEALRRCRILLGRLVREQKDAKEWLENFFK
ncbi:histidine-phosphotransfer domain, HPT domain-containing protein [Rhodotorula sp. JG-1b]|nr:histidine-phosphotransfer domain, HPT domain-containing protein [Rhodotorula sp. JG-1b]